MRRGGAANCSPEQEEEAAARGGARVASEGLTPHSHLRPLYVRGDGADFLGPVFRRNGTARIRGLLDGPNRACPVCRRNFTGWAGYTGPVRHALIGGQKKEDPSSSLHINTPATGGAPL